MEYSGLPIPIGGSEPLSAVLLELSTEGLSVPISREGTNAPFPRHIPQGMARTPIASSNTTYTRGGFLENGNQITGFPSPHHDQLLQYQENSGLTPFVQEIQVRDGNQITCFPSPHHDQLLQYQENSGLTPFVQEIQVRDQWKHSSSHDGGRPGSSAVPNMQQKRDQSVLNRQKAATDHVFKVPRTPTRITGLNGPKKSSGLSTNSSTASPRALGLNQRNISEAMPPKAPRSSSVSPMTILAQRNMVRQIERNRTDNHEKQIVTGKQDVPPEKQIVTGKQDVPPEKHGSSSEYTPGCGGERVTKFVLELQNRPKDNNIAFWKKLVPDFFAPHAKTRWCVSVYKKDNQLETLFSKAVWQCDLCNAKAGCGFEISGEPLPRLFKIKYDTVLSEHVRIGAPTEHRDESGRISVNYSEVVEETEYEQVRIVRNGQLRVVFSPDLKICSWDFCARNHEELIRRNSLTSQVHLLGAAAQNYQHSAQDVSSFPSGELQQSSDMFVSSAYQMVDALKMPFISQIGIVKRFVRCLQISEVLNMMNDLMLYSRAQGIRPTECMANFLLSGSNTSLSGRNPDQQPKHQHSTPEASMPPQFSSSARAGTETGLFCNGFDRTGVYTSQGLNSQKRQHNDSNSQTPVEKASLGFSAIAANQLSFPAYAASTPLSSSHPQGSHSFHGKLTEESTAKRIRLENQMPPLLQQDHRSNLPDPINPSSTANKIVQKVMAAQSYNAAEKVNGIVPTSGRAGGGKSSGGYPAEPDGVLYIDVENYQFKNSEIRLSAPNNETTQSNIMDMGVLPHNAEGKYPSPEFDDQLFEDFINSDWPI